MVASPGSALDAQRRWLAFRREPASAQGQPARIGVAATFTAEGVEPFLGAALLDEGVLATFSFADYNQVHQVALDPRGTLGDVEAIVVLWRLEDLYPDRVAAAAEGDGTALGEVIDGASELGRLVAAMSAAVAAPVIVSTAPHPQPVGFDLADSGTGTRLARLRDAAEQAFTAALGGAEVRRADLHSWQLIHGVERSIDAVKDRVYRQPYTSDFLHVLGRRLAEIIVRERRPAPKCIVLDADNTLWGGVIGEDGIGGIQLGSAFPGSAYVEFQRALKRLRARGVLLAVASKNNPREVDEVFASHDDMVLKADDIAVWQVNWLTKSESIRAIAAELNIGVDAVAFIDDSDYELAEVASQLPEVIRLRVPDEVALLPDLLANSGLFRNLHVTSEDLARTEMIIQERERRSAESTMSREEFLTSLQLVLTYFEVTEEHVGRVAQLTNKTNQFNLTTVRRSEADVRALLADPACAVRAIRVADKFGDYGLVGVAVVRAAGQRAEIDTLLMSCRVLGRGVETGFLAKLAETAKDLGATELVGRYLPTAKNGQVADLYPRHAFTSTGEEGVFLAAVTDVPPVPSHLTVR